ncbi:trypsin-like serine protease [Rhizobium leguminosarum]|uniref:trypsin-like serine protease n=1 Tax=Rhizobium leguminosarum TaxID=384 RepID=UPI001C912E74|nr:trypsin-like serine protease [Rhizobium leguminosarum]MBY2914135.1 trypsin-like serine protease [Rhizobium leguminosarum]MBY2969674.1 trypsin-like serine protease [Rhizobium leguminosarum]MBY2977047.1 trypsin-like serine protease [Rhizobium leguminosarum]MBY3005597.1 trypsin-like serine protease [Rhizobium leguminosarum]
MKPWSFATKGILTTVIWLANAALPSTAAQWAFISKSDLKLISPNASEEMLNVIVSSKEKFEQAGITNDLRLAHFLTQLMTETGSMSRLDENMNYKYGTLLRVFSRRTISVQKAREIERQPRLIANWVYGDRLGNLGRETDDGWNFRGSGFLQLTGRLNFRLRGRELGLPLESNPELARRPTEGLAAALAFWKVREINKAADANDLRRVRILVNGPAAHGFEQSKAFFYRHVSRAFQAKLPGAFAIGTETSVNDDIIDNLLISEGFASSDSFESQEDRESKRSDAIREVQTEFGLPVTGRIDEKTENELLQPREWRYVDVDDSQFQKSVLQPNNTVVINVSHNTGIETSEASTTASKGSGVVVDRPSIKDTEIDTINSSASAYASYETNETPRPETFVPYSVIEPDTRKAIVDTTQFPYRAVVQISFENEIGSKFLCSGAMISRDTVLTAAHCIHSGTSAGKQFRNFSVIPGRNVGAAPFGRCDATTAFLLEGWTQAQSVTESRYFDLGALKLKCDAGLQTGWFALASLSDGDVGAKTTVVGYAADRAPPGRQWISHDHLVVMGDLKGFYGNDTYGGTSGAPVFLGDRMDTLVGIHTNGIYGEDEPWRSYNAFTLLNAVALNAIAGWVAR